MLQEWQWKKHPISLEPNKWLLMLNLISKVQCAGDGKTSPACPAHRTGGNVLILFPCVPLSRKKLIGS
ncbi:hypothetical protein O3P69_008153 [Scylla paramamosain]|uniref:Uncharacterized protein n=1 Tax=Scylla paramamosain TaxID=85552 RepID=A0AAW0T146_SCYPA